MNPKNIYQGHVFDLNLESFLLPNGKEVERPILRHPGAVVIIPKESDGKLLLVKQYRYSVGRVLLEFPAGTLEENEEIKACARREIIEETGFQAESWTELGILHPCPGFCDELQHLFLATELSPKYAAGDEDEIMEVVSLSPREVEVAAANGEMTDAKSLAIFFIARAKGVV